MLIVDGHVRLSATNNLLTGPNEALYGQNAHMITIDIHIQIYPLTGLLVTPPKQKPKTIRLFLKLLPETVAGVVA